ncbi:MAG TPA: protein-glutamate O-methyltransferase CheR [Kofleriaceae bacterium]|jgi:chemotaxis protein methyltransferase CheR|nr:protein-glutamate O-methyltransferase CheR [Kofleriaceae bacterium]
MSPQLFAIFASLIEAECGVHYSPNDRDLLQAKLAAHASELGFDSLLDFYYRLRYDDPDGAAKQALVEALVVHETYFFRELPPLRALVAEYLVPLIDRRRTPRVWSAACSTGEEPFTLAMLLDERGLLGEVELVATDISDAAIVKAKQGQFGKRSLRDGHPIELAQRYLDKSPRGVTLAPRIRDAVGFARVNLVDVDQVRALGVFDVILCRNVLIYMRDAQIARLLGELEAVLTPRGVIAVGVSESLLRFGTALRCEERGGAFFYRRAGDA